MANPDPMITLFALRMIQEGHTCLDPDNEGDCPICDKWETGSGPVSPDPSATKKGPTVADVKPATDEERLAWLDRDFQPEDFSWYERLCAMNARIGSEVARAEKAEERVKDMRGMMKLVQALNCGGYCPSCGGKQCESGCRWGDAIHAD